MRLVWDNMPKQASIHVLWNCMQLRELPVSQAPSACMPATASGSHEVTLKDFQSCFAAGRTSSGRSRTMKTTGSASARAAAAAAAAEAAAEARRRGDRGMHRDGCHRWSSLVPTVLLQKRGLLADCK